MRTMSGLALLLCALVGGAALATEPPTPKVLSDAPASSGSWRMEFLEVPGTSQVDMAKAGGGMTICQTAAKAMSRDEGRAQKSSCQFKMVEDSATRAVMDMTCPDDGMARRTTITRIASRSYEMSSQDLKKPAERPARFRMSYLGPCSEKDSVIGMEKDSPACKQMRTQLGEIEKAKASCVKAGDAKARASCEQMIERSRVQILSMCGQ